MADLVPTFDPGRYTLIFRGREIVQFADGTGIKFSRASELYTKKAGLTGNIVRVRKRDTSCSCTITLQQTSPSNDDLSLAAELDQLDIPLGVGELLLKDFNGTTVIHALQAWVSKLPDFEVADDLGGNEWMIDTGPTDPYHIGGSLTAVI